MSQSNNIKREPGESRDASTTQPPPAAPSPFTFQPLLPLPEQVTPNRVVPTSGLRTHHSSQAFPRVASESMVRDVTGTARTNFMHHAPPAATDALPLGRQALPPGQSPWQGDTPMHAMGVPSDLAPRANTIFFFDIHAEPLSFTSLDNAVGMLESRTKLTILQDDVAVAKLRSRSFVQAIKQAFIANYEAAVQGVKPGMNAELAQEKWTKWQADAVKRYNKHKSEVGAGPDHEEVAAWKLYQEVITVHGVGYRQSYTKYEGEEAERKITCSERLSRITKALADYPIIRIDALKDEHMHDIAKTPFGYAARKRMYFHQNMHRGQQNALKRARDGSASRASSIVSMAQGLDVQQAAPRQGSMAGVEVGKANQGQGLPLPDQGQQPSRKIVEMLEDEIEMSWEEPIKDEEGSDQRY